MLFKIVYFYRQTYHERTKSRIARQKNGRDKRNLIRLNSFTGIVWNGGL